MRRKLLTIFVFLLIASLFVSCGKTDTLNDTETEVSLTQTNEVADESLPLLTNERKNNDLDEKEEQENSQTAPIDDVKSNNKDIPQKKNEDILECTLLVKCDTVFENITEENSEKAERLVKDGIIFPETKVVYYSGESVFNVLKRELKKNKIHIDFVNSPMYNTAYIRGISNLYEHDFGDRSGWLYRVNGKVPSYGCSQYIIKPGDKIEFLYTCDMGKDIVN